MSEVKAHLTKVANDLINNRQQLERQQEGLRLQIVNNEQQLAYFDTLIASVKNQLASGDVGVSAVEHQMSAPDLLDPVQNETNTAPQPAAGGSAQPAAAPSADGGAGTDANGAPVSGAEAPVG